MLASQDTPIGSPSVPRTLSLTRAGDPQRDRSPRVKGVGVFVRLSLGVVQAAGEDFGKLVFEFFVAHLLDGPLSLSGLPGLAHHRAKLHDRRVRPAGWKPLTMPPARLWPSG
jgi:hypothetical protein